MSSLTDSVSISILDRDYQFTCLPEERAALRAAGAHLDDKMREVKSAGNLMALERIAVMTALNLSDELLKLRAQDQRREEQVDQRIRILADELDNALHAGMD